MAFATTAPILFSAPNRHANKGVCVHANASSANFSPRKISRRAALLVGIYAISSAVGPARADVEITDLKIGGGAELKEGQLAKIDYTLSLDDWEENGGHVIDSSRNKKPFRYNFGKGQVIKGWDKGIAGMRVGGRRRLVISPDLAYGERGVGVLIPPNSVLYFDVELLGINS